MKSKLVMLGIAVVAIGLVALPQTLALFSGQHNFYDVLSNNTWNNTGTAIPCLKCHADVYAELTQKNPDGSTNLLNQGHLIVAGGCAGCHITDGPGSENKNGNPEGATNVTFHAAAAPACIECHTGADIDKGAMNATLIFNGSEEVHKPFANQAYSSKLLKDANEACVACHTHVAVSINWDKAYMMTFNATETADATTGHNWTVDTFNATGSANTTSFGNQTGGINSSTAPVASLPSPTPIGFNPSNP
ncbi:MAG: hypothetical protein O8C62_10520 [Candidatus Methanoperedens sp.]|nr:hypothetical protein [Candidatus Methanoperedens sp.]